MTAPDKFGPPLQEQSSGSMRPTPEALGGVSTIPDSAFGRVLGQHRRAPHVDAPASAALERHREEIRPRALRLEGSAVSATGVPLVIDLGGPKPGFVWTIRRINVGPVDYAAGNYPTVNTVIALVTSQETGINLADSAAQVVSQTTAYPAEGTWGREELVLQAGDYLRIVVVGLALSNVTAGITVTASAAGQETAAAHREVYAI